MAKKKTIEVELRGPLTKQQYENLQKLLEKDGQSHGENYRVLIDYSTFLKDQEMEGRTRDIRLRVTNKIPEIIVKLGKWSASDPREELSVTVRAGEFDTLVRIFAAMGYTRGMLCERRTQQYTYRGAEFSLVDVPDHSYHFEAEMLLDPTQDTAAAQKQLEKLCSDLGLIPFTDKKFFEFIETLNREANEAFEFDRDYKPGYFNKRFHLEP